MAKASSGSGSVAPSINRKINRAKRSIESYDDTNASGSSDDSLTSLWSAIKSLEDAAEELRKEVLEPEMESRVAAGDRISGVQLIESHRKYVEDDAPTVIGRAVGRGINYTEFVSLDATVLASDYPDLADIGRNEYTYFR